MHLHWSTSSTETKVIVVAFTVTCLQAELLEDVGMHLIDLIRMTVQFSFLISVIPHKAC